MGSRAISIHDRGRGNNYFRPDRDVLLTPTKCRSISIALWQERNRQSNLIKQKRIRSYHRCPTVYLAHRWIHRYNINMSSGAVYIWIWPYVGKLNACSSVVFAPQHAGAVISNMTGHRSSGSAQMLNRKTEPRAAAKCKLTRQAPGRQLVFRWKCC